MEHPADRLCGQLRHNDVPAIELTAGSVGHRDVLHDAAASLRLTPSGP